MWRLLRCNTGGEYPHRKPDNVAVLHASGHPEMTLVACYPFYYVGSAPDRFIAKARLIELPTAAAPTPRHMHVENMQTNGFSFT
jgi:hypothetical protein